MVLRLPAVVMITAMLTAAPTCAAVLDFTLEASAPAAPVLAVSAVALAAPLAPKSPADAAPALSAPQVLAAPAASLTAAPAYVAAPAARPSAVRTLFAAAAAALRAPTRAGSAFDSAGASQNAEGRSLERGLEELRSARAEGRAQDALDLARDYFLGERASLWFAQNPHRAAYRQSAQSELRLIEKASLNAYQSAGLRGQNPALVAETRTAAATGQAPGRAWRPTALQRADAGHCALHALYNAVAASSGFAAPTTVDDFIAAARAALDRPAAPGAVAALAPLGLSPARRAVDEGLDGRGLAEWAARLGLTLSTSVPPRTEAGWSALLSPGRETLLAMRFFHSSLPLPADQRATAGHDYRLLNHETYLLGAFDSPSLKKRLFLAQDSGSGTTLMATAEELSLLTQRVEVVGPGPGPVAVPAPR